MTRTLLATFLLTLTGCSTTYKEHALPDGHPANPAAVQSEPSDPSRTLDLSAADPVRSGADGTSGAGGHDGHGAGGVNTQPPTHQHGVAGATGGAPAAPPIPSAPANAAALFVCPMHPEVTSDKPDQRCPKCGMKLRKQTPPTMGGQP